MSTISIHNIETEEEYIDLLKNGMVIDINETISEQKINALYYASEEKINWLIKNGININHTDSYGQNMLHNSTFPQWEFWIAQGINVHQVDNNGENILFSCPYYKQFMLFYNQNVNVHQVNNKKENLYFSLPSSYDPDKIGAILFSENVDLHQVNTKGQNVLFLNLSQKFQKKFIESGVNVNQMDNKGETPIFHADSTEIIDMLLEKGADINKKNSSGQNALMRCYSLENAKHLVNKGIDVSFIKDEKQIKHTPEEVKSYIRKFISINKEKEILNSSLNIEEGNEYNIKKRM